MESRPSGKRLKTPIVTELFQDLDRGGRAIAATRRLARQAAQRYADWKMQAGAGAWPTPRVRVCDDWLLEIWQAAFEHLPGTPRLLSEDQELLLWEQVIRRRPAAASPQALLQLSGTARTARQSWNRIHQWQLEWRHIAEFRGADSAAFLDWAGALRRVLDERNWLTGAELAPYLVDHAAEWLPAVDAPVWWLGFDGVPPALQAVAAVLERHGSAVKYLTDAGIEDAAVSVVTCDDSQDEWRRIARWARAELDADPRIRLGVVCPDLNQRRDEIEEILEDVLHPELPWHGDAPRVYHLSLGRPLAAYPIVGSALDVLRWTARRIPFDTASRTLRSPYVGASHELDARVALELALRDRRQESFTHSHVESLADELPGLEDFRGRLAAARELDASARAAPADWAALFSDWLRAFNWPGDRPLDSHEHQALNAWRELLSRFAALTTVQARWSLADAVKKLAAMASARILQFHDDQAPLQIMGAPESAGLWFDKLWLADMSDTVWPPPARPDPFIPVPLQKAAGMPEASAQIVLARARERTAGLLASASVVTVSFAPQSGDAQETLSPLFADWPAGGVPAMHAYRGRVDQLAASGPALEVRPDELAPALDDSRVQGGVALVADQALCPFRALAHHRLHARELNEVAPGLDPRTRGTLLHDAMRRFWETVGDRDRLGELDKAATAALVDACAAGALQREFADSVFRRRFLELEHERLAGLLREWMALEVERPAFRVAGTEVDMDIELGGVGFRVRADRIDELADGRRLIIDYKTGRLPGVGDWADPRLEEPQLPMYALGIGEEVAALALAGVRRGECELRGIADGVDGIPGLRPVSDLGFASMSELRSRWASALNALVEEYRRGVARVEPKDPRICRHCDAMALCRIFERGESVG